MITRSVGRSNTNTDLWRIRTWAEGEMHRTMGTVDKECDCSLETLRRDRVRQNCRRRDQFRNICGDAGHRKFVVRRER